MNSAGHVVLITGGGSGIGFALAEKFNSAGNTVILVGRNEETLAAAAAQLPGVITRVADVAEPTGRAALIAEFPHVSVLVNNAGIQKNGWFAEANREDVMYELEVNLAGPVLLCREFLPTLMKMPEAAIINVSSGLAIVPKPSAPIYCATKAALHSFTKALRWQLEATSVKVFEVLPPLVDTAMTEGRGRGKITPARLANEFWSGYLVDRLEMQIGKTKLLAAMNRFLPSLAEKIMRANSV
jgi:uncharacterized oxidoreductase